MTRAQELEQAVKNLLDYLNIPYMRVENYVCYKCHTVQNSQAKGWPDFFCLIKTDYYKPDNTYWYLAIECKTGKGDLTPEQKSWRNDFIAMPCTGFMLLRNTVDELIEYLKSVGYNIK